jgi:hypothetical protein
MPEETSYPFDAFPQARYFPRWRLLCWRPTGVLDDVLLDRGAEFLSFHEQIAEQPFDRFTDLSGLTDIRIKVGHIFAIAAERREAAALAGCVKSAFYANTIVGLGIARLYESLMEGSLIQVLVFRERPAAAAWLGVPHEVLEPGPESHPHIGGRFKRFVE